MRRYLGVAAVVLTAGMVAVLGWYVVEWRTGLDAVAPNVTLDGRSVGLMGRSELVSQISRRAEEIRTTPVLVEFPGGSIIATAADLGVDVDEQASFGAVMGAGRGQGFFSDFASWARGPWVPRQVEMVAALPFEGVAAFLRSHPGVVVSEPVEPAVILADDEFVAVASAAGSRLDIEAASELVTGAFVPGQAMTVSAPTLATRPSDTDAQAMELVERLNTLTDGGITVELLGHVGRLSQRTLQESLDVAGPVSASRISFDPDVLQAALLRLFETVSRPGTDPVFEIDEDGVPVVVTAGSAPQGCCGPDSGEVLVEALEADRNGPVEIPPADSDAPELVAWAAGKGVVEVVGEFSTEHACCEQRVANIHRIADLIRGQYLRPGESFSVNEFVGERTPKKGFVPAGVIERGRFTESVGGGISQFATTLFNAAFFAGLELDEYQSHSIYISRYPYGREATLSFPKPDLRITNSTEHPVLIWTSYTDTSITVSIYSTDHIDVSETGQEERPFSRCTDVETFRQREYLDGRVVEDSVVARYRPGEGLDCNGNPTPQP